MDVLDGYRENGYCAIQNQQSAAIPNGETSLTSNPFDNDQHRQSASGRDNLQYASRAEDREANNCEHPLDHSRQHEQQQHESNECNFMAANEGYGAGPCQQSCLFEAENELGQDDAFVPFCAEAISTSDSNPKYYTNKLYKPLKNGANQVQQNQVHHYHQSNQQQHLQNDFHLEDRNDALSMYAELEFMGSASQKTVFNKILEDDDGDDEANIGKDNDDSLDDLQLTSLIDSFVEFAGSPLENNQNDHGLGLPLYPALSSNSTELPTNSNRSDCTAQESSTSSDHQINELNLTSSDSYYPPTIDSQYRRHNLFDSQSYVEQSGTCYTAANDCVTSTNTEDHHQLNDNVVDSSQSLVEEQDQDSIGSTEHSNKHSSPSSESHEDLLINNKIELVDTTAIAVGNNSEKSKRSFEEDATTMRRQKLKKRRSKISYAERNKQQTDSRPVNETNDDDNDSASSQMDHMKELDDRLMNDEEDLGVVSDNNSLRSESSRRNPVLNHYRRRTANARERIRMREINQAFEKLKKVVPIELVEQAALESGEVSDQASARGGRRKSSPSSSNQGDSVKLTKITTLRMAVSYIAKLTEILNQTHGTTPNTSGISELVSETDTNSSQHIDKTSSRPRPSRSKSRKSTQNSNKRRQKGVKIESDSMTAENKVIETPIEVEMEKSVSRNSGQQPMIVTNPTQAIEQQDQRPQQHTAFISIPDQQKRQYFTSYPNQQLLISQPISNERLVTPVAVAILGIPTTNNNNAQSTYISRKFIGSQNIQLVGAFISIPEQQKRQYLTSYPNQQLLISPQPLGFTTHYGTQSGTRLVGATDETNITKLVTNLATSIQPQNNHLQAQSLKSSPNASEDCRQKQVHQQQLQQQQPVRTYRFHNYYGNTINNHIYGNNNS